MPQLVESCGMFFFMPLSPPSVSPFPISSKKTCLFILFCLRFVLSLQYQSIYAAFAVSKIYADESTHSKYK